MSSCNIFPFTCEHNGARHATQFTTAPRPAAVVQEDYNILSWAVAPPPLLPSFPIHALVRYNIQIPSKFQHKPIEDDLMGDQVLSFYAAGTSLLLLVSLLCGGRLPAWVFRRAIPVLLLNGRPPQFIRQAPVPMIKLWGPILCAEGEF